MPTDASVGASAWQGELGDVEATLSVSPSHSPILLIVQITNQCILRHIIVWLLYYSRWLCSFIILLLLFFISLCLIFNILLTILLQAPSSAILWLVISSLVVFR